MDKVKLNERGIKIAHKQRQEEAKFEKAPKRTKATNKRPRREKNRGIAKGETRNS